MRQLILNSNSYMKVTISKTYANIICNSIFIYRKLWLIYTTKEYEYFSYIFSSLYGFCELIYLIKGCEISLGICTKGEKRMKHLTHNQHPCQ